MRHIKAIVPFNITYIDIIPLWNSLLIESSDSPEQSDNDHLICRVIRELFSSQNKGSLHSVIFTKKIFKSREIVYLRSIESCNSSPKNTNHKERNRSFLDEIIESFVKEPLHTSLAIDILYLFMDSITFLTFWLLIIHCGNEIQRTSFLFFCMIVEVWNWSLLYSFLNGLKFAILLLLNNMD